MRIQTLSSAARVLALAALAFGLAGAAPVDAGPPDKAVKKQKPRQVHPTGEEDVKAPSAAELAAEAALEQMTNRSTEGLTVVQHDNGMAVMDLEGRFMSVAVAVTRKDGSSVAACVHSHEGLAKAQKTASDGELARPQAAPPAAHKAPVLEEK